MGIQSRLIDERNRDIKVYVGGSVVPRDMARVSVFDSSVQGGDAVWEGLRVYSGRIAEFDAHLDRLFGSAHAMAFSGIPTRDDVKTAVFTTLQANGMQDGVHIRLTLTRGEKVTSGMSPHFNKSGCLLIVLAEWKAPVYESSGIRLITSAIRRNSPQCIDSKIHHNNLINNILAKIQANHAGVDDALMLDLNGFVSETNATNVFIASEGNLLTPCPDACLPGITRGLVISLAKRHGVAVTERNISLTEVYNADEVFVTGTMGELTPVLEVDGRTIVDKHGKDITRRLQGLHRDWVERNGYPIPREYLSAPTPLGAS